MDDAAVDVSNEGGEATADELSGVFQRKLVVRTLVILGQWDPSFNDGREVGMHLYAHAKMAVHEEGHRLPQDQDWSEAIRDFLKGSPDD